MEACRLVTASHFNFEDDGADARKLLDEDAFCCQNVEKVSVEDKNNIGELSLLQSNLLL